MRLAKETKLGLIKKYCKHEKDNGSAEVQVSLLTERINSLTDHFRANEKDHHSRRGLLLMVGRRRKLLGYLKKHDFEGYKKLIAELGIRK
ncbi:MAG: 30S ribosomal protein S15 [Pseudomonadota bacterium]